MGRVCKYFSLQSLKMMSLGMKLGAFSFVAHVATDYQCASQHKISIRGPRAGL
jgi:hypothetical protein